MKSKKMILFFIFLTLLTGLAIFQNARRWHATDAFKARSVFPKIEPGDIHSFTIEWNNLKPADTSAAPKEWNHIATTVSKIDGIWRVEDRNNAYAQNEKVIEFLNGLCSLVPLKELENCDAAALQALRLVEKSDIPAASGLIVTLRDRNSAKILEIILGVGHFTPSTTTLPGYETSSADGRYILLREHGKKDRVFLISRIFEDYSPSPQTWLEPLRIPDIHRTLSATVSTMGRNQQRNIEWRISRDSLMEQFQLEKPENTPLNIQELSNLFELLSKPFSGDIITEPPPDFKPALSLNLLLDNGFSYALAFEKLPTKTTAIMMVRFDAEKILRHPNENDVQFEARKSMLKKRAEYDEALSGKCFYVPPEMPDILMKPPVMDRAR